MRALVVNDGRLEIATVAEPTAASDQAVVAVRAFSLNRGEVRGVRNAAPGARPGWDVAGHVEAAAADGSGPRQGERVVGIVRSGGWGERVAIKTRDLAVLPDAVPFEDASTLPVAALTALRALELGGLLLGKRVLITGAAGGVGRFAVQLARRAGAHVTGIVGRPERGEGLRELGADEIVTAVDRDQRYDLVLESVGGESLETSVAVLAPAGTVVVYGSSSERPASIDARALFIKGRTNVRGLFIFDEIEHDFSAARGLGYLASLVAEGALKTEIAMTRPWTETAAALEELSARRVAGKAVLVIE